MRAVVTEIRDAFAAVLSDDGRIVKVKNQNYAIGQVITMRETNLVVKHKIIPWVAAVFAVFMIGGGSAYAYYSPYSYVSFDVNPSIEYTLNRFDRVLSVKAVNEDGQDILDEIGIENIENQSIEEAISRTVEEVSANGYFDGEDEGGIVIATFGKDETKAEELAETLKESAEETTDEEDGDVEVEAISVGRERVQQARELGVTPGKLNLVQKLQSSTTDSEEVDLEEWLNKPVKEIMKEIKQNRKGHQTEEATDDSSEEATEEDITKDSSDEATEEDALNTTESSSKATKIRQKTEQKKQHAEQKLEQKNQQKIKQNTEQNLEQKTQEKMQQKVKQNTKQTVEQDEQNDDVDNQVENEIEKEPLKTEEQIETEQETANNSAEKVEKANEKSNNASEKADSKSNKSKKKN